MPSAAGPTSFTMQEKRPFSSSAHVSNLKKEPQAVSSLGLPLVLPQTLGFYAERLGVSGDGAAAQSWPKRIKSFQQIALAALIHVKSEL